ncbi:hypothetical protein Drorol1_Dr00018743 [Drosera rotundifolia]
MVIKVLSSSVIEFLLSCVASMDHIRVHPRFLHSNATSHKWALGAFAELLDNALDEVSNGAKFVVVDVLVNPKDDTNMLLVQDDGGGMSPDKMRQCMSLGYSSKSKCANIIGQYGNGFKTSTMRLGADIIVFSCCGGKDGKLPTKSIGLLSYTFLKSTGKEDIVVPMIDFEKKGHDWTKIIRLSPEDWHKNLETIVHWSPYSNEDELLQQFDFVDGHGTRIIIYNLWEDDAGQQELDFDTDKQDIQIRGNSRDEKNIQMSIQYPNSGHFLTYRHSLRSYASILYLRLPPGFRMILRGKEVDHHDLLNDMIHASEVTYRPASLENGGPPDKNPFWRVWNAAGSDGRGVIGVLEANFIAPAHDKQGFERTIGLSRLEARLVHFQKTYWRKNCDKIGYAPRIRSNKPASPIKSSMGNVISDTKGHTENLSNINVGSYRRFIDTSTSPECPSADGITRGDNGMEQAQETVTKKEKVDEDECTTNNRLTKRLREVGGLSVQELIRDLQFERDRSRSLESQLQKAEQKLRDQVQEFEKKIKEMDKEQETLIEVFQEEREKRVAEEDRLRKQLKRASVTVDGLVEKVKRLEKMIPICKTGK